MMIKIDTSYFFLKSKPSLLRPLRLTGKSEGIKQNLVKKDWNFRFLQELAEIDDQLSKLQENVSTVVNTPPPGQSPSTQNPNPASQQINSLLILVKHTLKQCQYYNLTLNSNELFTSPNGLLNLYKFPQSFKPCTTLTQLQRSLKTPILVQKAFPYISVLQRATILLIQPVIKMLKENMFLPSSELFEKHIEKLNFAYDDGKCLRQNVLKNGYTFDSDDQKQVSESYAVYYELLILRECSTLEGLCHYLSYAKNILLDRKSGALVSDHDTWVAIYQACLKIYCRNQQVRQNKWLQIDQILSTQLNDQQFTQFLLNSQNLANISLASMNFYVKNLNKTQQLKILPVIQQKIISILQSQHLWQQAQDIVQHLDNECSKEARQRILEKIIQVIIKLISEPYSQKIELLNLQIGLSFFVETLCHHLPITKYLFTLDTLTVMLRNLKSEKCSEGYTRIMHHLFTEVIVTSYEQSDELSVLLQENQELAGEIFPELLDVFGEKHYSLPKEFYKLVFHSVSDVGMLGAKMWRGIAELYFEQSFEETIDMELFHAEQQGRKRIADHVVQILKQLTLNNAKQHIIIKDCLQSQQTQGFQTFLMLKSFKDSLIFNNLLVMSTFLSEHLPLTNLSALLAQFYTPLVPDIKWKSPEHDNLTLLSYVAEELPIDILKATYKLLKQGFSLDPKVFAKLSSGFWHTYISASQQNKVKAIVQQSQNFTFQTYQSLHSFRLLDLTLNMINCVFDKLNEHSQKSIKQLKIMYQWGIQYIRQLQRFIYPLMVNCVGRQFCEMAERMTQQEIESMELYSRSKNISVLDLYLCEKFHVFHTFNDFNKIGHVIGNDKAIEIQALMYPCFVKNVKQTNFISQLTENDFLNAILKAYVLIQNSCLQEVGSDQLLSKVSNLQVKQGNYLEKSLKVFESIGQMMNDTQFQQKRTQFMQKPMIKKILSHLKLLMGKIYIPFMTKSCFNLVSTFKQQESILAKTLKSWQLSFSIMKNCIQIIHSIDPLFEDHFSQLMQVIQQHFESKPKVSSDTLAQSQEKTVNSQILLKTLETFFGCVLQNIKVRSFHIFKLIKLYLKETQTDIKNINLVIKFYIDMFFAQFIKPQTTLQCFNEQVREKTIGMIKLTHSNQKPHNNEKSRIKILTPQKSKDHLSLADKVHTPLKKQKISLQQLKNKKQQKCLSPVNKQNLSQSLLLQPFSPLATKQTLYTSLIPQQLKKLLIQKHSLTTVQCSCTLSMFMNLFARLNYSSLPTGIEAMLARQNDKIAYLKYLQELTSRISLTPNEKISPRDLQILNIDVYGNLNCILKGKIPEQVIHTFITLTKAIIKLQLPSESIITLPIKLLNQRLFLSGKKETGQQFSLIRRLLEEFQEEPLAYELAIKSHMIKIGQHVRSNLHVCNLQYIIGPTKNTIAKKTIQTNYRTIQTSTGKSQAKKFLKKFESTKPIVKKQLQVSVDKQAVNEVSHLLESFSIAYNRFSQDHEASVSRLYFGFRKICAVLYNFPELFVVLVTKASQSKGLTFVDMVLDSLKYTLVFFCEFYVVSAKINAGFVSKDELRTVVKQMATSELYSKVQTNLQQLQNQVPMNLLFQTFIKLTLLKQTNTQQSTVNPLRALNFTIKQSQQYRLRQYKFIRINNLSSEAFIKNLDQSILSSQLSQLSQSQVEGNFAQKLEMLDLCLENYLSGQVVDFAKVKLDEKLKETFVSSSYSIKCLQSFNGNREIQTLKVLEEDEEEKSVSSSEGVGEDGYERSEGDRVQEEEEQIEEEMVSKSGLKTSRSKQYEDDQVNRYSCINILGHLPFPTSTTPPSPPTSQPSHLTQHPHPSPLCLKQLTQLKSWLKQSTLTTPLNLTLLSQLQKSCQKLITKQQAFEAYSFEDTVYMTDAVSGEQLEITAFTVNGGAETTMDGFVEDDCGQLDGETSFMQDTQNHDQAMIMDSQDLIQQLHQHNHIIQPVIQHNDNPHHPTNQSPTTSDNIIQAQDSIIEEEDEITQDQQHDTIKISIAEETHVNRLVNEEQEDQQGIIQSQLSGTNGSIQFSSSIKTLDNIDNIEDQQQSELNIQEISQSQLATQHQPHIITANSTQSRQYHYTIDNFTNDPRDRNHDLALHSSTTNNLSLVDAIEAETLSNQHVHNAQQSLTKQSIFQLLEEYALNPQLIKVIKLKIKKINSSQLKKVHLSTSGQLKQQVQRQLRLRGLYFPSSPHQTSSGSLFSISQFVNQSFQIDQSKFYLANYKKYNKKPQQSKKIQTLPVLNTSEWLQFVLQYYAVDTKDKLSDLDHCNPKDRTNTAKTVLEAKSLSEVMTMLLLNKDNLLTLLEVLLNVITLESPQQLSGYLQGYVNGVGMTGEQYAGLQYFILNQVINRLVVNRIGLPVLFKGKWNFQTKKLIRYEFQCLVSDSNLNNNRSQGQPLLQVFLRKSIHLIHRQLPSSNQQSSNPHHKPLPLIKSLTQYFKSVQNFQSNTYPYYFIQDTIKLCHNLVKNNEAMLSTNYKFNGFMGGKSVKVDLCEMLINTMRASSGEAIEQYQDVFYLMNYLDFETFSQFLNQLIQQHKPLVTKLLQRQLSLLKRFRKSSQSLPKQKLPQIYWHMRKSSKSLNTTPQQQKQLQFFTKTLSMFSSKCFKSFKQSVFSFGYGKQEIKKKQHIAHLNKLLINPSYEGQYQQIKEEIEESQREYLTWKLAKNIEILKEDILPVVEKIASEMGECLRNWQMLFEEMEELFGTDSEERVILFKQCAEFYKVFLSLQLLLQEQESTLIRTMSSLKTKPSLESTRDMGVTGRRRSSLKLPRVSLTTSQQSLSTVTFKSVFKTLSPKFGFFSSMIPENSPQLKIHAKYSTLEAKLKLLHQKSNGPELTIQVKRDRIWQDTLPYLTDDIADKNIKVKIQGEIGLDYGGVRRQWITLIVKQLMNPNLGLFALSVNGLSFQPSATSYLLPNHLFHFHKLGILVGKALKENWLLEINFTKSFLKHLLGFTLYVEDLEDIDPETAKSLLWILNNDVGDGDLGIDFTHEVEVCGKKNIIELCQNARQVLVTEQNKKDYVKKLANFKMTQQIRQQSKAFMSGLQKVVQYETLRLFSYKELGIYLAGMPTVDVQQMQRYTRYQNFSVQDQQIKWFWQTLSTYTQEQKANFLFFLTGSYKVPYGGFKQNPITINKMPASKDYLPVAHTCFSVIDLPQYTSKEKLSTLLDKAITEGKGFSVS